MKQKLIAYHSAAEQFIGIVVSCMPILPAFYNHLKSHHSQAQSSNPNSFGKKITSSIMGHKSSSSKSSKGQPKDPYPLYSTRGYEELDEIEAQRKARELGGIVKGTELTVISENR